MVRIQPSNRCLHESLQSFFAVTLSWLGATAVPGQSLEPLPLMEPVTVSGLAIPGKKAPAGLVLHPDMGLLTVDAVEGQLVHRTKTRILETHRCLYDSPV